jgi:Ankyrin repeats (3 copies)
MEVSRDEQLINAIPEGADGDIGNLRELLSCSQEEGRARDSYATINLMLYFAAERDCPEACRLICERRLDTRLKTTYYDADKWNEYHFSYSPLVRAAEQGHVDVLRVLKEYNFNLNQKDRFSRTPLYYARGHPETCRFLLENGADPNEGGLYKSVKNGNVEVTRLLLNHGADPTRIGEDEFHETAIADVAILNGYAEILSMLMHHGAMVGARTGSRKDDYDDYCDDHPTSLNYLLWSNNHNRDVKVSICRLLVSWAGGSSVSEYALLLKRSLAKAIENCELYIEAGLDAGSDLSWALDYAIEKAKKSVCRLLVNSGADPFSAIYNNVEMYGELYCRENAPSPLHCAARKTRRKHVRILEYFLQIWQERFASSSSPPTAARGEGKHSNGDYLIHFLCRDKFVSLKAIRLVVEEYGQVDKLKMTNKAEGLRPLLVAAMSDASLDIIFYLLKHHPNASLGLESELD